MKKPIDSITGGDRVRGALTEESRRGLGWRRRVGERGNQLIHGVCRSK